tara:strand:- start:2092 stop:2379 length:288 start_codon:yes stop_codon:yes gene_type:complete
MIIYVDIDGTICDSTPHYEDAKPIQKNIDKINKLYDDGHTIIYWTARGTVTNIDWLEITQQQLFDWGCKSHDIRVGKPEYDMWIDDKSFKIEDVK